MLLLASVVLLTWLYPAIDGSGVFEIRLVNFLNREGRKKGGDCCEASIWSWFYAKEECENCNHVFDICVGNDTQSSSMASCDYGRKKSNPIEQNHITFGKNVGDVENPVKVKFDSWPSVIKLKIDILHQASWHVDFIDHFDYEYRPKEIRRQFDAIKLELHLKGSVAEIQIQLHAYCDVHYFGPDCAKLCRSRDDGKGHYRCNPVTGDKICMFGWAGPDCLINLDDCNGHKCQAGATCIDLIGYYQCKCPPGRAGVYCEGEINECASLPCLNGGTCLDKLNEFTCQCPEGWTGRFCETKIVHCVQSLCVHGYCTMKDGKDICICDDGYKGVLCDKRVKSCADNPCLHAISCVEWPERYQCICKDGYTGNICETKISSCDSYPCLNNGICIDSGGSFVCSCPDGFYGDRCETKINECNSNPCQNGGLCVDLHLSYICRCPATTTGFNCERFIDQCHSNPCLNGGTCVNTEDGYQCMCLPDTDSPNCELFIKIDFCSSFPCKNNATCENLDNAYEFTCKCPEGYLGKTCDVKHIDFCKPQPCKNGGQCSNFFDKFECDCPDGYTGQYCEEDINECEDNPCKNGGTCQDLVNGFKCICTKDYTGDRCTKIVDRSTVFEGMQTTVVHPSEDPVSTQTSLLDKKIYPLTFEIVYIYNTTRKSHYEKRDYETTEQVEAHLKRDPTEITVPTHYKTSKIPPFEESFSITKSTSISQSTRTLESSLGKTDINIQDKNVSGNIDIQSGDNKSSTVSGDVSVDAITDLMPSSEDKKESISKPMKEDAAIMSRKEEISTVSGVKDESSGDILKNVTSGFEVENSGNTATGELSGDIMQNETFTSATETPNIRTDDISGVSSGVESESSVEGMPNETSDFEVKYSGDSVTDGLSGDMAQNETFRPSTETPNIRTDDISGVSPGVEIESSGERMPNVTYDFEAKYSGDSASDGLSGEVTQNQTFGSAIEMLDIVTADIFGVKDESSGDILKNVTSGFEVKYSGNTATDGLFGDVTQNATITSATETPNIETDDISGISSGVESESSEGMPNVTYDFEAKYSVDSATDGLSGEVTQDETFRSATEMLDIVTADIFGVESESSGELKPNVTSDFEVQYSGDSATDGSSGDVVQNETFTSATETPNIRTDDISSVSSGVESESSGEGMPNETSDFEVKYSGDSNTDGLSGDMAQNETFTSATETPHIVTDNVLVISLGVESESSGDILKNVTSGFEVEYSGDTATDELSGDVTQNETFTSATETPNIGTDDISGISSGVESESLGEGMPNETSDFEVKYSGDSATDGLSGDMAQNETFGSATGMPDIVTDNILVISLGVESESSGDILKNVTSGFEVEYSGDTATDELSGHVTQNETVTYATETPNIGTDDISSTSSGVESESSGEGMPNVTSDFEVEYSGNSATETPNIETDDISGISSGVESESSVEGMPNETSDFEVKYSGDSATDGLSGDMAQNETFGSATGMPDIVTDNILVISLGVESESSGDILKNVTSGFEVEYSGDTATDELSGDVTQDETFTSATETPNIRTDDISDISSGVESESSGEGMPNVTTYFEVKYSGDTATETPNIGTDDISGVSSGVESESSGEGMPNETFDFEVKYSGDTATDGLSGDMAQNETFGSSIETPNIRTDDISGVSSGIESESAGEGMPNETFDFEVKYSGDSVTDGLSGDMAQNETFGSPTGMPNIMTDNILVISLSVESESSGDILKNVTSGFGVEYSVDTATDELSGDVTQNETFTSATETPNIGTDDISDISSGVESESSGEGMPNVTSDFEVEYSGDSATETPNIGTDDISGVSSCVESESSGEGMPNETSDFELKYSGDSATDGLSGDMAQNETFGSATGMPDIVTDNILVISLGIESESSGDILKNVTSGFEVEYSGDTATDELSGHVTQNETFTSATETPNIGTDDISGTSSGVESESTGEGMPNVTSDFEVEYSGDSATETPNIGTDDISGVSSGIESESSGEGMPNETSDFEVKYSGDSATDGLSGDMAQNETFGSATGMPDIVTDNILVISLGVESESSGDILKNVTSGFEVEYSGDTVTDELSGDVTQDETFTSATETPNIRTDDISDISSGVESESSGEGMPNVTTDFEVKYSGDTATDGLSGDMAQNETFGSSIETPNIRTDDISGVSSGIESESSVEGMPNETSDFEVKYSGDSVTDGLSGDMAQNETFGSATGMPNIMTDNILVISLGVESESSGDILKNVTSGFGVEYSVDTATDELSGDVTQNETFTSATETPNIGTDDISGISSGVESESSGEGMPNVTSDFEVEYSGDSATETPNIGTDDISGVSSGVESESSGEGMPNETSDFEVKYSGDSATDGLSGDMAQNETFGSATGMPDLVTDNILVISLGIESESSGDILKNVTSGFEVEYSGDTATDELSGDVTQNETFTSATETPNIGTDDISGTSSGVESESTGEGMPNVTSDFEVEYSGDSATETPNIGTDDISGVSSGVESESSGEGMPNETSDFEVKYSGDSATDGLSGDMAQNETFGSVTGMPDIVTDNILVISLGIESESSGDILKNVTSGFEVEYSGDTATDELSGHVTQNETFTFATETPNIRTDDISDISSGVESESSGEGMPNVTTDFEVKYSGDTATDGLSGDMAQNETFGSSIETPNIRTDDISGVSSGIESESSGEGMPNETFDFEVKYSGDSATDGLSGDMAQNETFGSATGMPNVVTDNILVISLGVESESSGDILKNVTSGFEVEYSGDTATDELSGDVTQNETFTSATETPNIGTDDISGISSGVESESSGEGMPNVTSDFEVEYSGDSATETPNIGTDDISGVSSGVESESSGDILKNVTSGFEVEYSGDTATDELSGDVTQDETFTSATETPNIETDDISGISSGVESESSGEGMPNVTSDLEVKYSGDSATDGLSGDMTQNETFGSATEIPVIVTNNVLVISLGVESESSGDLLKNVTSGFEVEYSGNTATDELSGDVTQNETFTSATETPNIRTNDVSVVESESSGEGMPNVTSDFEVKYSGDSATDGLSGEVTRNETSGSATEMPDIVTDNISGVSSGVESELSGDLLPNVTSVFEMEYSGDTVIDELSGDVTQNQTFTEMPNDLSVVESDSSREVVPNVTSAIDVLITKDLARTAVRLYTTTNGIHLKEEKFDDKTGTTVKDSFIDIASESSVTEDLAATAVLLHTTMNGVHLKDKDHGAEAGTSASDTFIEFSPEILVTKDSTAITVPLHTTVNGIHLNDQDHVTATNIDKVVTALGTEEARTRPQRQFGGEDGFEIDTDFIITTPVIDNIVTALSTEEATHDSDYTATTSVVDKVTTAPRGKWERPTMPWEKLTKEWERTTTGPTITNTKVSTSETKEKETTTFMSFSVSIVNQTISDTTTLKSPGNLKTIESMITTQAQTGDTIHAEQVTENEQLKLETYKVETLTVKPLTSKSEIHESIKEGDPLSSLMSTISTKAVSTAKSPLSTTVDEETEHRDLRMETYKVEKVTIKPIVTSLTNDSSVVSVSPNLLTETAEIPLPSTVNPDEEETESSLAHKMDSFTSKSLIIASKIPNSSVEDDSSSLLTTARMSETTKVPILSTIDKKMEDTQLQIETYKVETMTINPFEMTLKTDSSASSVSSFSSTTDQPELSTIDKAKEDTQLQIETYKVETLTIKPIEVTLKTDSSTLLSTTLSSSASVDEEVEDEQLQLETYKVETLTIRPIHESSTPTGSKLKLVTMKPSVMELHTIPSTDELFTSQKKSGHKPVKIQTHQAEEVTIKPLRVSQSTTESPSFVSSTLENSVKWLYDTLSAGSLKQQTLAQNVNPTRKVEETSTVSDRPSGDDISVTEMEFTSPPNIFSAVSTFIYTTVSTLLKDDRTAEIKQDIIDIINQSKKTTFQPTKLWYTRSTDAGIYTKSSDSTTFEELTKWPVSSTTKSPPIYRGPTKGVIILYPNKPVIYPSSTKPPIVQVSVKGPNGITVVPGILYPHRNNNRKPFWDQQVEQGNNTVFYYTRHPRLYSGIPQEKPNGKGEILKVSPQGVTQNGVANVHVKLTVYKLVKDVTKVSNATVIEAYTRAREMLRKTLEQLAKLWRSTVQGVVEVAYVTAQRGFADYSAKLTVAYKNMRKAYVYGCNVLRNTYNHASAKIVEYFNCLSDYFKASYNYYYDLFEATKRIRK